MKHSSLEPLRPQSFRDGPGPEHLSFGLSISQPCLCIRPHYQYTPCAGQAPGADVNFCLQIGNLHTGISIPFMNSLILKQQISENANVQLFLVGTFQAVLPACLVPARASATEGARGPLYGRGGALAQCPHPFSNGACRTSRG